MELFETTGGHLINPDNVEVCKDLISEGKRYLRFALISGNSIDIPHDDNPDSAKEEKEAYREHVRHRSALPIYAVNTVDVRHG